MSSTNGVKESTTQEGGDRAHITRKRRAGRWCYRGVQGMSDDPCSAASKESDSCSDRPGPMICPAMATHPALGRIGAGKLHANGRTATKKRSERLAGYVSGRFESWPEGARHKTVCWRANGESNRMEGSVSLQRKRGKGRGKESSSLWFCQLSLPIDGRLPSQVTCTESHWLAPPATGGLVESTFAVGRSEADELSHLDLTAVPLHSAASPSIARASRNVIAPQTRTQAEAPMHRAAL